MINRHTLFALFALLPLQLRAERAPFCALSVHVSDSKGGSIKSTWIELLDPSGKVVRKEMVTGGSFQICDFGFGPHTLRVGVNECLPVAISNLRVVLGKPVSLDVVLNPCSYRGGMRNGCLLYFRIVDSDNRPIPGVTLSSGSRGWSDRADAYGRWQHLGGGEQDFTLSKPGYEPATVHTSCRDDEEIDREIQLRKLPTGQRD